MTPFKTNTFVSELIREGSWGSRAIGTHESTMDLYLNSDNTGYIEWDVPDLEVTECIGLWFEIDTTGKRTLSDYDGVFSLPEEAIELMREGGILVPEEYEA